MKKQNYLVVDDDTTNNMICEFTIKRFDRDANIKMFTQPEDALTYINTAYNNSSETLPTVLFLDVNMPTMTGWEFLDCFMQYDEWVREQFTIYILSSSIEDFTKEAKTYPCIQGFLSKPLKIAYLEIMRALHELPSYA